MAEKLSIFGWNVQSPGQFGGSADPDMISDFLSGFTGYDIYAFCEVLDQNWADGFKSTLEESEQEEFGLVLGTTGWGGDKLLVLCRKGTLEQTGEADELVEMQEGGGRAPLVVPFRIKPAGIDFQFMMNHLHSSNTEKRIKQVKKLNEWGRNLELPVIAAGDYNFFDVRTGGSPQNDEGFRLLTMDNVFQWVRPENLIQTQFDAHYDIDWILDFIFSCGEALTWKAKSNILLADKPREFFLSPSMTDHRPVDAQFDVKTN